MFPVFGSCMLFGLYVVFKTFDKFYVNLLLKLYFLVLGVVAMSTTLHPFAKDLVEQVRQHWPASLLHVVFSLLRDPRIAATTTRCFPLGRSSSQKL